MAMSGQFQGAVGGQMQLAAAEPPAAPSNPFPGEADPADYPM